MRFHSKEANLCFLGGAVFVFGGSRIWSEIADELLADCRTAGLGVAAELLKCIP
jgi:hypothetical protein